MAENKNNTWIWILLIIAVIILGGIMFSSNKSSNSESSKCSTGYYWTGSSCCYDGDSNQICDSEQKVFKYVLNCNGINDMSPCVNMCISKCAEIGFRIAVSAVDGDELASHPYLNNEFYCNCVPK